MTIPVEYLHATRDFERFMLDARDVSGLSTTNMAWNMVVGVLHAFRRRPSVGEALRFAAVLPPVVRAIFVADWDTDEERIPSIRCRWLSGERLSARPDHLGLGRLAEDGHVASAGWCTATPHATSAMPRRSISVGICRRTIAPWSLPVRIDGG